MRGLFLSITMSAALYMGCVSPTTETTADSTSDVSSLTPASLDAFKDPPAMTASERAAVLAGYAHIPHDGVRQQLFEDAMVYYDTNKDQIPNKRWVTIVDF